MPCDIEPKEEFDEAGQVILTTDMGSNWETAKQMVRVEVHQQ